MVARLATLEAAGVYAAAYRLIDVAFIPVRALLSATLPGFFRAGDGGLEESMRYGKRMLMKALPYSLFAFAAYGRQTRSLVLHLQTIFLQTVKPLDTNGIPPGRQPDGARLGGHPMMPLLSTTAPLAPILKPGPARARVAWPPIRTLSPALIVCPVKSISNSSAPDSSCKTNSPCAGLAHQTSPSSWME